MFGLEERLEWLRDFQGRITISQLLNQGLDIEELFELDNYEDFCQYLRDNSNIIED